MSSRVVLSIGSNMGDRLAHLQSVVDGLGSAVTAVSPVFETAPWGGVDQEAFLNAVVLAEGELDGRGWLHRGQEFERAAGRVREEHWGPRTLDVDVISCSDADGEYVYRDAELTLPHPHAHQRAFVLVPWLAVAPAATLTVDGVSRPVAELIDALPSEERAGVWPADAALRC